MPNPVYELLKEKIPVLKTLSKIKDNDCWVYTGSSISGEGHARIKYEGRNVYLHRIVFCILNKLDYEDKDFQVNHRCNSRNCFNPDHLYKGDHLDNMKDRSDRITGCLNGHPYNESNPKTLKGCKICRKEYMKKYYIQNKKNWNPNRRKTNA